MDHQRSSLKLVPSENQEQIARISMPTREEFESKYLKPRVPVIIENSIDLWEAKSWTPESLNEKVGQELITYRTPAGPVTETYSDAYKKASQGVYLRNINLPSNLPSLYREMQPHLPFIGLNWKTTHLLPKNFLVPGVPTELFVGESGVKFPILHLDYWGMDGLITQIYGEKEFVLFPLDQSEYLYPQDSNPLLSSIQDLDHPNLGLFPNYSKAKPIRFILKPGDSLYNPGYWHTTKMVTSSITIIQSIWHKYNWSDLISELHRTASTRGRLKTHCMSSYLKVLSMVLPILEASGQGFRKK